MIVMKFGGTSVGSAENMESVRRIITSGGRKIVVLSAMSGTTNSLVEICSDLEKKDNNKAKETVQNLKKHYLQTAKELLKQEDYIQKATSLLSSFFDELFNYVSQEYSITLEKKIHSYGEIMTTNLFTLYLNECGENATLLSALNFMRTKSEGEPDMAFIQESIQKEIENYPNTEIFITQGYICKNNKGEVDNLTRGGSDYSATIIGAALKADEIVIWSDKDGLLNNDPRFVDNTFPLSEISYGEAEELAYFGAKILHPTCIVPARKASIPVKLKNTMNTEAPGTLIFNNQSDQGQIKAIAAKDDIVSINIKSGRMMNAYGFLRKIFEVFERYKTPVDMITTSEVAVSVTIDQTRFLADIITELEKLGEVVVQENQSIVCVVGNIPPDMPGISSRIFKSIANIPLKMISYGASQRNITVLIDTARKTNALNQLNQSLFLSNN